MTQERLERFYSSSLEVQPDVGVIPVTKCPKDRFEACVRYLPEFFRGGTLLDLGAGSTLVARSLLAAGIKASSIKLGEFSQERLNHIQSTITDPRLSVRRLDAEQLPPDLGAYDAILMIAVIEHLIDPISSMRNLRTHLKDGGFVWIDTPNIAKWTRRLKLLLGRFPSTASRDEGLLTYSGEPSSLHDEGHLHYFTYRSLCKILVEWCGYSRVVKVPYCESPLVSLPVEDRLARLWPSLFSEVSLIAYK